MIKPLLLGLLLFAARPEKIDGPIPDLGIDWKLMRPAYHALNVFLRDDGTWIVVEPQNGRMTLWKSLWYEGNITVMSILI